MSDDCKKPSEVKTAADEVVEQPSQRRRRLVKGALSAPVFLTLQNGAVFANTSNDAQVVTNNQDIKNGDVCVFSDSPGYPKIDGDKIDFGEDLACFDEFQPYGNPLQCQLNGQTKGGYIVTASSATSICP